MIWNQFLNLEVSLDLSAFLRVLQSDFLTCMADKSSRELFEAGNLESFSCAKVSYTKYAALQRFGRHSACEFCDIFALHMSETHVKYSAQSDQ